MVTELPRLRPASKELLNNIAVARRIRETDAENSLYEDWKRLVQWLQSELRVLAPALRSWAEPRVLKEAESACVYIEADATWTFGGDSAVSLGFSIFPGSGLDDDADPNVHVSINTDWEHCDALRAALTDFRPPGFTSTIDDGTTDPECPFWRSLPLQDYQQQGAFELQRFVADIAAAFECLAPLRSVIDGYLAQHIPPPPLVPQLRKALILDLETWGPGRPDEDEIAEVGLILTAYDSGSGELAGVLDRYESLRDPGPRSSAAPSGRITRRMVKGKRLDHQRVKALIDQADLIIAHNAYGFDRPRFERLFPSSKSRHWLCSCRDLGWSSKGLEAAGLEHLCERLGVTNRDPHRAMSDADALLRVLAHKDGAMTFFAELIGSAQDKARSQAAAAGRRS